MKRENNQKSEKIDEIPVFTIINEQYSGKPKKILNNTTSYKDGLLYFLIAQSTSFSASPYLVICDKNSILYEQIISLRGTVGMYGSVYDGKIGIFTNNSNYGYYCYSYDYDIVNNTLQLVRQIPIGRNWYWGSAYSYKSNDDYYIVGTFNNSLRGPTTVNLTTGEYYVNEINPRDDLWFFSNDYRDNLNPFLAISGARRSDGGDRYFQIKKLPNTYNINASSGSIISNGISNSLTDGIYPLYYYDVKSKIKIIGTIQSIQRIIDVSDDYTQLTIGGGVFPSGYNVRLQVLLSSGIGYYCDLQYNYQKYNINDYL